MLHDKVKVELALGKDKKGSANYWDESTWHVSRILTIAEAQIKIKLQRLGFQSLQKKAKHEFSDSETDCETLTLHSTQGWHSSVTSGHEVRKVLTSRRVASFCIKAACGIRQRAN